MEENERVEFGEDKNGNFEEEEEQVWSWGAGTEGQLGTGKLEDEHFPLLLSSLAAAGPISFLSCGGAHVIALTPCGKVLTWGRGTSGQLGHGEMVNSLRPKPVNDLKDFVVSHVSAGWSHSGFVSDCGSLFTCGDGSFGQLGHGDNNSLASPKLVSHFGSKHVCQIAFGMRHSLAALKGIGNHVYGFGSGKRGQLGVRSRDGIKSLSIPQLIIGFEDVEITSISANGDHSAALSSDGHLYTWGRGFCGAASDAYYPQCMPSSLHFTQVALGWNHALLLSDDGEVFMLGGYHHGVLSDLHKTRPSKHLSDLTEPSLLKVDGLNGIKVVQIAAGAEHSALVTESGVIKTWGWGEHGQLGLGSADDQITPRVMTLPHERSRNYKLYRVYCGSGFTFAVKSLYLPSQC